MKRLPIMLAAVLGATAALGAPTNQPTATNNLSLSVGTNGVLNAPSNFFSTNRIPQMTYGEPTNHQIMVYHAATAKWIATNSPVDVTISLSTATQNWNTIYNWGTNAVGTSVVTTINSRTDEWNTAYTDSTGWTNWGNAYTASVNTVLSLTSTWNTAAQSQVRYFARTNADSEIIVRATTTGITATVVADVVTLSIPNGTVLMSARIRWPASLGYSSFTLDLGTNDMGNTGFSNRWGTVFSACREDTGAYLSTASYRLDTTDHDQLIVSGLISSPGSVINSCMFVF